MKQKIVDILGATAFTYAGTIIGGPVVGLLAGTFAYSSLNALCTNTKEEMIDKIKNWWITAPVHKNTIPNSKTKLVGYALAALWSIGSTIFSLQYFTPLVSNYAPVVYITQIADKFPFSGMLKLISSGIFENAAATQVAKIIACNIDAADQNWQNKITLARIIAAKTDIKL